MTTKKQIDYSLHSKSNIDSNNVIITKDRTLSVDDDGFIFTSKHKCRQ